MSTPVSHSTPPRGRSKQRLAAAPAPSDTATDMQAHVQRMIDLQYEQQKQYASSSSSNTNNINNNTSSNDVVPEKQEDGDDSKDTVESKKKKKKSDKQEEDEKKKKATTTTVVPPLPTPAIKRETSDDTNNVGLGTLIWTDSNTTEQIMISRHRRDNYSTDTIATTETEHLLLQQQVPLPLPGILSKSKNQMHANLASYGAIHDDASTTNNNRIIGEGSVAAAAPNHNTATNTSLLQTNNTNMETLLPPPPPPPPPPSHPHFNSQRQPQQQQQQQQPPFHDPYVAEQVQDAFRRYDQQQEQQKQSVVHRLAAWLWSCFCCCCCCNHTAEEEEESSPLHRSFCYGAIDGMLTGAGIVSTFCGMNLLSTSTNNSPQIRALVVAFTAATCFADAVCMALGHIWTTHVLAAAQALEREHARRQLSHSKADAKGLLVDMLLAKGMLKIDAMSLADTLEGYPDLFVSALTGESLSSAASLPPQRPQQQQQQQHGPEPHHHQQPPHSNSNHPAWRTHGYPSYGRLTEFEMDPDALTAQTANAEARKESLFMLLGFSLFAVVPSLIYTWVPAVVLGSDDTSDRSTNLQHHGGMMVNLNSLVIFLTACVMWCLGVWKSRFLDSNWLVFGIESVLVFLVCIACAYGVGTLLNKLFLPDDYLLEVAKTVTKAETVAETSSSSQHSSTSSSSEHHYTGDLHLFF